MNAISFDGTSVFAGGTFASVGAQKRNGLAAINVVTGQLTSWDPNANNMVTCMVANETTIFVGGDFTAVGGQTRHYFAGLDPTTGLVTAFDPNSNGRPRALAVSDGVVYAGGWFDVIGGQGRIMLAALDATTGLATPWTAHLGPGIQPPYGVYALAVDGPTLYAGGTFDNVGSQIRKNLAAIDRTTGEATAWNPAPDNVIYALTVGPSAVYAGGNFSTIGGQARSRLAALDKGAGLATPWSAIILGRWPAALSLSGNTLYAGGSFIEGDYPNYQSFLVALDATTGALLPWNGYLNGTDGVSCIASRESDVYAGGSFDSVGGLIQLYLASFYSGTTDVPRSPLADGALPLPEIEPNPFGDGTAIRFTLAESANVTIGIYDVSGREVASLIRDERQSRGSHQVMLDGRGLSTGLYLCRIQIGSSIMIAKMVHVH